jgi:alpha-galactosidase
MHSRRRLIVAAGRTPAGTVTPTDAASGQCLDVPNGNTTNGTQPINCNGGPHQEVARIRSGLAGAGHVPRRAGHRGSQGTNQRRNLNANGTISNVASGLCLDVKGNATTAGSLVILWTRTAAANQVWTGR